MAQFDKPTAIKFELLDGQDERPLVKQTVWGVDVYRIRFLTSLMGPQGKIVGLGQLGGWLQHRDNLSQHGICVVLDDSVVLGRHLQVWGTSRIEGGSFLHGSSTLVNTVIKNASQVSFSRRKTIKNVIVDNNRIIQTGQHASFILLEALTPPQSKPLYHRPDRKSGIRLYPNGPEGLENLQKVLAERLRLG